MPVRLRQPRVNFRSVRDAVDHPSALAKRATVGKGHGRGLVLLLALGVILASAPAQGQEVADYRTFSLGSPRDTVLAVTRSQPSDITVLHRRPRLIEEVVWRPRFTPGVSLARDPAREIYFRFIDNQLFSIQVFYDAYAVEGLSAGDLVRELSRVYGEPVPTVANAIARWEHSGTEISLSAGSYPSPFRLLVVDPAVDLEATRAAAEAVRLDRLEAPAREKTNREADRERRDADDAKARERSLESFTP